jgi:purine-binding chemotaxis protein CheW
VLELFTFSVGAHRYAVDLARVDEVLPEMPVQPLPGAHAPVEGCIQLRGERVPVVALRAALGEAPAPPGSRPGLLVCWLGRRRVAFAMDGVGGVVPVAASAVRVPAATETVPPGVVAVWAQPPGATLLLDVLQLLRGKSPSAPRTG